MTDIQPSNHHNQKFISIVMNQSSGRRAPEFVPVHEVLANYFSERGFEVELHLAADPLDLVHLVQKAVAQHKNRKGVIVAAGGDGTVNAVAHALLNETIPMGIIPLGTFNYVARALDIPLELFAAADVIVHGHPYKIHVGCVNQYIYLNNASIGLYPRMIEQREQDNSRYGRFRAVALISGFAVLMREHQKLKLKLSIDGQLEPIETPLVFFGNNPLQLQDYNLELAECAAMGKLAVVAITEVSRWQILKLITRLQVGTFEQAPEVTAFCADQIRIDSKASQMKVAIDGEIIRINTPLYFSVAKDAVTIMVPKRVHPLEG
jgi:diacylglycerol kinase family enzyme